MSPEGLSGIARKSSRDTPLAVPPVMVSRSVKVMVRCTVPIGTNWYDVPIRIRW